MTDKEIEFLRRSVDWEKKRVGALEIILEDTRQQLAFESHKCSKCGTNLGLLHEDACPLCNCRQQLAVASYWGPRWEKEHAENELLRQQLKVQQDAANHWFMEANNDHNRCVKLEQQLAECQAKLDSVMLEYCPENMTPEQIANWEKHQVVAKELE